MIDAVRGLIDAHQAVISLVVLAVVFVGFAVERYPATVIAVLGACTFLALGILDADGMYSVFSNSAPIVIGAMFVLSGALIRTGVINRIGDLIVARAERHPRLALVEVFGGMLVVAGFINNTPMVVIMLPIMFRLAEATGISPKKLLMPLSIVAVLGGTLTLVGTSTNLVVDGIVRDAGLPAFGIFEITPIGIVTALSGMVGMAALSWLLPADRPLAGPAGSGDQSSFLTELIIKDGDARIGGPPTAFSMFGKTIRLVGVRRGGRTVRGSALDDWSLAAGDRMIVRTDGAQLMTFAESKRFDIGIGSTLDPDRPVDIVEAMVSPVHPAIGQRLPAIPFLQKVRARVIGVQRPGNEAGPDLSSLRVRGADRLIVQAGPEALSTLRDNPNLIGVGLSGERAFRRRKAWIAVSAMAGVIGTAALGLLPIGVAAVLAIGVILATRCIDGEEAWDAIDGNVLILIFAMLAIGLALERSGAVAMMVGAVGPLLTDAPAWTIVFGVYFFALILSELLSNNAVAALLTPVTIALAAQLGVDARPLLIALMIGASACFATPIGYQTNTIVYAAGDYRFVDFVRIGVPLNLITGVATCLAIVAFML